MGNVETRSSVKSKKVVLDACLMAITVRVGKLPICTEIGLSNPVFG